ncbi:hypothetical protein BV898_06134 [Hypsibius exemplaris]|uniref:Uncharacterized protein n=1 Tax=Hypsibius exemplaris TaxID=2072580 RepID=A0A1W0WXC8_HYPEX|nr:hypothetical protein BV898_06134 [Hypsibius exemplaris]
MICLEIMFANLYNLVVFRLWSHKELYLLFHIVLAVEAAFGGFLSIFALITRNCNWTNPTQWSHKIPAFGLLLADFTACCGGPAERTRNKGKIKRAARPSSDGASKRSSWPGSPPKEPSSVAPNRVEDEMEKRQTFVEKSECLNF